MVVVETEDTDLDLENLRDFSGDTTGLGDGLDMGREGQGAHPGFWCEP